MALTKAQEAAIVEALSNPAKELEAIKKSTDKHEQLIHFLLVALFLGFLTLIFGLGAMLIDTFRSKEASYSDLVHEIRERDTQIQQENTDIQLIKKGLQKYGIIPRD